MMYGALLTSSLRPPKCTSTPNVGAVSGCGPSTPPNACLVNATSRPTEPARERRVVTQSKYLLDQGPGRSASASGRWLRAAVVVVATVAAGVGCDKAAHPSADPVADAPAAGSDTRQTEPIEPLTAWTTLRGQLGNGSGWRAVVRYREDDGEGHALVRASGARVSVDPFPHTHRRYVLDDDVLRRTDSGEVVSEVPAAPLAQLVRWARAGFPGFDARVAVPADFPPGAALPRRAIIARGPGDTVLMVGFVEGRPAAIRLQMGDTVYLFRILKLEPGRSIPEGAFAAVREHHAQAHPANDWFRQEVYGAGL